MQLPKLYLNRMKAQLGADYGAYLAAMDAPPRRALRVNTLKLSAEALFDRLPFAPAPDGVVPEGFFVPDEYRPGRDVFHAEGLYYMQEPSAQYPASLFDFSKLDCPRVLDLCAAPGGKASQLAAMMGSRGVLFANEPVPSRADTLRGTLERLGVVNAVVTCMEPAPLCRALSGFFDAVLVDAPCAGEGMFRKEEAAVAAWSIEHVRACALRQTGILFAAAEAVRPGGTLVYATCSFSPEENEGVVEALVKARPEFSVVGMRRLYPHDGPGEGQFAARLYKDASADGGGCREAAIGSDDCPPYEAFIAERLRRAPRGALRLLPDGRCFLLPGVLPANMEKLRLRAAGLCLGEVKNGRFLPAHALAMAVPAYDFSQSAELSSAEIMKFLAGESVCCDKSLAGFLPVTYRAYAVGFGKAVTGTLKNHIPKGLRLR